MFLDKPTIGSERCSGGFTLVELLVTLTVLALFFVTLAGAVRLGGRAWEIEQTRSAAIGEMEAVHLFIRRVLAQARTMATPDSSHVSSAPALIGASDAIGFAAPMPPYLSNVDVAAISLRLVKSDQTSRLMVTWAPWVPHSSAPDATHSRTSTLVNNVRGVRFSYFGPLGEVGDMPRWSDEWRSSRELPWLVRMRLVTVDGAAWPDLIVALHHADVPWRVGEHAAPVGDLPRAN